MNHSMMPCLTRSKRCRRSSRVRCVEASIGADRDGVVSFGTSTVLFDRTGANLAFNPVVLFVVAVTLFNRDST